MKIKIDIKSVFGNVLFSFEKENNTIKDTLVEANLEGANLEVAYLRGADYSEYTSFLAYQCPIEGSFIGWKKMREIYCKTKNM